MHWSVWWVWAFPNAMMTMMFPYIWISEWPQSSDPGLYLMDILGCLAPCLALRSVPQHNLECPSGLAYRCQASTLLLYRIIIEIAWRRWWGGLSRTTSCAYALRIEPVIEVVMGLPSRLVSTSLQGKSRNLNLLLRFLTFFLSVQGKGRNAQQKVETPGSCCLTLKLSSQNRSWIMSNLMGPTRVLQVLPEGFRAIKWPVLEVQEALRGKDDRGKQTIPNQPNSLEVRALLQGGRGRGQAAFVLQEDACTRVTQMTHTHALPETTLFAVSKSRSPPPHSKVPLSNWSVIDCLQFSCQVGFEGSSPVVPWASPTYSPVGLLPTVALLALSPRFKPSVKTQQVLKVGA